MIALGFRPRRLALKRHVMEYLDAAAWSIRTSAATPQRAATTPTSAGAAAEAVASGACDRGIVICTTGIGISIAANKVKGIRCALCSEPLSAEMTRRHNDANMLAMGAGIVVPIWRSASVDVFLVHRV